MKTKIRVPLFWKFTIAIITVVALFGSINLYFINYALFDLSNKEINRHGISTAKVVVERSIDPILYDDIPYLNKIVSDNIKIDPSIAYIIILDKSNNLLAHTFENSLPLNLLDVNKVDKLENFVRIIDKKNPRKIIRAMSAPILNGDLGKVYIGIYEENFSNSIASINSFFLSMVILFLFFGILVALIFSYVITSPIKKMSKISENLNLDVLKLADNNVYSQNLENSFLRFNTNFRVTDEIDVLTNKFNEMLMRLRKTYSDLQSSQETIMQSEKIAAIGTLSAGLAHEINNPIAGIQNCLRRIADNPNNMKQNSTYLELMSEAINKIELVVGGLLNFSRKHELVFSDVDLKTVVDNVSLLIEFQIEKSQIEFTKNYQPNLPLIKGSKNHLEQVVLNLLINALDAVDEREVGETCGKGEIKIKLYQELGFVKLDIIDNGIGIPEEKINNIFDPFFTMKKIKQGTGLGLSVSYNIMAQHKGTIKVKRNQKSGMCFTISLPIEKQQNE